MGTGSREWLPRAEGNWQWRVIANRYKVSFWGDKNILKLDWSDGCAIL